MFVGDQLCTLKCESGGTYGIPCVLYVDQGNYFIRFDLSPMFWYQVGPGKYMCMHSGTHCGAVWLI